MTIAAACRYAEIGVGAAIAPGSQKWNGASADLLSAPARISGAASITRAPDGGAATIAARLFVPAAWPSAISPTSIARPPVVVTISAVRAAERFARRVGSWPISR